VFGSKSAGDLLQWHPHLHLLTSDGGLAADGPFVSLARWDATLLLSLFLKRILARLLDRHAIFKELVQRLLAWRPPGFSAHVGERIDPEEKQRLCDTVAYLVRNPLCLRARGRSLRAPGHPAPALRSSVQ
jgi:hypothetical protein